MQHNKHLAASSAAKLRARQEEELRAMVAEQERKANEFERLFDLVGLPCSCCLVSTGFHHLASRAHRFDGACVHSRNWEVKAIVLYLAHCMYLQQNVVFRCTIQHSCSQQHVSCGRHTCKPIGKQTTMHSSMCAATFCQNLTQSCISIHWCHSAVQIRNQRNRFVALIATARQAATEMTDRLRLLSSEQEILTAEVATKAQLLDKVMQSDRPCGHPHEPILTHWLVMMMRACPHPLNCTALH